MEYTKWIKRNFYKRNNSLYKDYISADYEINSKFRNENRLTPEFVRGREWKYIKYYRNYQVNADNIWGVIYKRKLRRLEKKTGISFEDNISIGKGLIIGHWGRIILNHDVKLGNNIFLTHGVTIGRDIRGARKGTPTIGNRVCIRANSTIVGKVTIGDDVLIAPNTFVNFDVPSHSVVIGNPASIHQKNMATQFHIPETDF